MAHEQYYCTPVVDSPPPAAQFHPSPPPNAVLGMDETTLLFMAHQNHIQQHQELHQHPHQHQLLGTETDIELLPSPSFPTSAFLTSTAPSTTRSIRTRSTRSYDRIDGSERDDLTFSGNTSPLLGTSFGSKPDESFIGRRRHNTDLTIATSPERFDGHDSDLGHIRKINSIPATQPAVRRASTRGVRVRHPTPGLQTLQGAYTANVVNLEEAAEKLSMTSSIEDSIRREYEEQKRSDSRMSSMRPSSLMDVITDVTYGTAPMQLTSPTSIIDVNSAARSGGYSPAGAILPARARADSKSSKTSKYGTRPEPELEGRPLHEFVSQSRRNSGMSAHNVSRPASMAEKDEEAGFPSRPLAIRNPSYDDIDIDDEKKDKPLQRTTTSDSNTELENAQKIFDDFDGQHFSNPTMAPPIPRPAMPDKRISSATMLSTFRPKSYADPLTGQEMVYYPAPVPSMLQLPQKLSNRPSAATIEKRRTRVLSTLPTAARKSAVWLPDVLEGEQGEADNVLQSEYLPQHHKQAVGGRRSTQDLSLMPEQLRASTFFEQSTPKQTIEIKGQSAVKTLDDILDASAFAPVSAFTDHAIAGRLGAEVYGADENRKTRTKSQMFGNESLAKPKRATFFGLGGKSNEKDSPGRNTMSILGMSKSPTYEPVDDKSPGLVPDGQDDSDEPEEMDERYGEDVYTGAPTTLLAELQLRKQHAKNRTQPSFLPGGFRSTLLEMDAVAQVESKARQQKRVTLAWQDKTIVDEQAEQDDEDDDVPLGMLFPDQARLQRDIASRPMGLLERRELEDNEPLSKRRERLLGRQPLARDPLLNRASTMMEFPTGGVQNSSEVITPGGIPRVVSPSDDDAANPLPAARPVSGDFTSELLHQFGGDAKGKEKEAVSTTPFSEENETLGQRRRRLIAEREAREREVGAGTPEQDAVPAAQRPVLKQKRSMADILSAHPAPAPRPVTSRPKPELHRQSSMPLVDLGTPELNRQSSMPLGAQEYPHLMEYEMQRQQQRQQQLRQSAMYSGLSPNNPYGRASNIALNYQGQQGLTSGFASNNPYAAAAAGPGMYPGAEDMASRMAQLRIRAQQQQQQLYAPGGGVQPGQWQNQQAQWQHWARMQGLGMGLGGAGAGYGGLVQQGGGVDMVERWRRSVMAPGAA